MKVVNRKIDEIRPYGRNTKKHDQAQIDNVAESIRQYSFVQPVVIDKNDVIVIGHCRVLAAKQIGMETVPCVCVDDLTPEQVNALRIVDNKTNESPWDFDLLNVELPEIDLSGFDFDFELDTDFESPEDEEIPDINEDDLDKTEEKQNVIVSINCNSAEDYNIISDRIKILVQEINATMAVKMA